MKRLILIVASVVILGVVGCAQTQTPAPKPYTPKYTADQVIVIAQAKYPTGFKQEIIGEDTQGVFRHQTVTTPTSISVKYIGGSKAAWEVKISLPFGYRYSDYTYGTKTLYFYEGDGSLRTTYYP